jgi:type II secretory pathway component PulJ
MRKRSLTLLEVLIATVLVGILLTTLFSILYQSLKKQPQIYVLKQQTLHVALFDQLLKQRLNKAKKIWTGQLTESSQDALFIQMPAAIDPDWELTQDDIQEILYLNEKKQLCLMTKGPKQQQRISVLLDQVDKMSYRYFNPKGPDWQQLWPTTMAEVPTIIEITLHNKGRTTAFAFFPDASQAPIPYSKRSS